VRKSDFSKAADEIRKRLDDEGYVVNQLKSLERNIDSVPSVGKPKVFKRPTQFEANTWDPRTALVLHSTKTEQPKHSSEIQESPAIESTTSSMDSGDDIASIASASFEDMSSSALEQVDEEVINRKMSHSDSPALANSGLEDRSSVYEDRKSNHSMVSFEHDQSQHQSNMLGASDYMRRVKEAHTDDLGIEETGHSSADSSSERYSSRSSDLLHDNDQRATRAKNFQPTAESEDEEADSKPSAYHPYADDSTYLYPENFEAGTKHHTEETDAPKGSMGINSSAVDLVEDEETNEKKPVDLVKLLNDVKETIKEEIWKQNKQEFHDEFEKKLEDEMRKRLAKFGFQDNQIQAMIHPEKAATMPQGMTPSNPLPAHQPTYAKVHKDHLLVDTLLYYDIPYEIDPQNPDYIIVLREMSARETEVLFEHTRRLRTRNSRILIEERADNKPDYAWVRRRKGPRHESYRDVETNDSRGKPWRRVAASEDMRSWGKRTTEPDVRDTSPSPIIKELNVNLQVPPFLAWPTTVEEDGKKTVSIESHILGPRTFLHNTTSMLLKWLSERH
jgi:hypothetical protein